MLYNYQLCWNLLTFQKSSVEAEESHVTYTWI